MNITYCRSWPVCTPRSEQAEVRRSARLIDVHHADRRTLSPTTDDDRRDDFADRGQAVDDAVDQAAGRASRR